MPFETALTPVANTPANTSDTTLFTASGDSSVLVDIANIGTGAVAIRVGITPSGGSVHWKLFDVSLNSEDALVGLGPWFLQSGDAVTVRTDTADDAVFSLTGVAS